MSNTQTTNSNDQAVSVGIIMGSDSDLEVMAAAGKILKKFDIGFEQTIVSAIAHRPDNGRVCEHWKTTGIKSYYRRCWWGRPPSRYDRIHYNVTGYWRTD